MPGMTSCSFEEMLSPGLYEPRLEMKPIALLPVHCLEFSHMTTTLYKGDWDGSSS